MALYHTYSIIVGSVRCQYLSSALAGVGRRLPLPMPLFASYRNSSAQRKWKQIYHPPPSMLFLLVHGKEKIPPSVDTRTRHSKHLSTGRSAKTIPGERAMLRRKGNRPSCSSKTLVSPRLRYREDRSRRMSERSRHFSCHLHRRRPSRP